MEVRFRKIVESDLPMVLAWRTRPDITKWLFTDFRPDMEKQRQWFENLVVDRTQVFWIVTINHAPVGALFLKDMADGQAELGNYFADPDTKSLGAILLAYFLSWAWDHGFEKLILHIFCDHDRLVRLHNLYGFKVVQRLHKFAKEKDVFRMEMAKNDYQGPRLLPCEVEL